MLGIVLLALLMPWVSPDEDNCNNEQLDTTIRDLTSDENLRLNGDAQLNEHAVASPGHDGSPDPSLGLWLEGLGCKFRSLSTEDRNRTLDYIISISEGGQLYHLSARLDVLLRRDFLVLLPQDLVIYLVHFLDARSLTTCCLVSRRWNAVINSCNAAWKAAARHQGVNLTGLEFSNTHVFKGLYLTASRYVEELRAGSAFSTSVMYGHRARVMTLYYHNDVIATGSDDHTVRLWDCTTGVCTKIIHTHNTVAAVMFDSTRLVTASFNTIAALWSVSTGVQLQVYAGHVGAVFSVDFDSHMDVLVTGSADSTVKVWVMSTGNLLTTLPHHRSTWITQVCLHWAPVQVSYSVLSRDDVSIHMWRLTRNHDVITTKQLKLPEGSVLLPGWQVNGPTVTYVTHSAPSTYHVTELNLMHSDDIPVLIELNLHKAIPQGFLGYGRMFCILLHAIDGERSEVTVIHNATGKIIATIPMPHDYRPSKRVSTFTLGSRKWLDGFPAGGQLGTFLVTVLCDNGMLQLLWRPALRQETQTDDQ